MWVKSSYSQNNGGCVEWKSPTASAVNNCVQRTVRTTPSICQNGECVELCTCGVTDCGMIHVRDSKDPDGVILDYPQGAWDSGRAVHFLPVARSIVAEHAPQVLAEAARRGHAPSITWYQVSPDLDMGLSLWFDESEREAWLKGVEAGEFDLQTA